MWVCGAMTYIASPYNQWKTIINEIYMSMIYKFTYIIFWHKHKSTNCFRMNTYKCGYSQLNIYAYIVRLWIWILLQWVILAVQLTHWKNNISLYIYICLEYILLSKAFFFKEIHNNLVTQFLVIIGFACSVGRMTLVAWRRRLILLKLLNS